MRNFFKTLSLYVLIVLAMAQLAMAQHSAVHFTAHIDHIAVADDHHDNDHHDKAPQKPDHCATCQIIKVFAHSDLTQSTIQHDHMVAQNRYSFGDYVVQSATKAQAYHARAPPTFLI